MSVPLLLLVLLPALAQADNYGFGVEQPAHLSAPKGDTIHIPFSFYHHWESIDVSISWRRGHFHGKFFYNMTPLFIHEDYKDRLSLNWTKGQTKGYLRISDLRSEDENEYFCRIRINTQRHGVQQWQSIHGTTLTIISENLQPGARTTTQGPTTTASLLMDESSASGPLSLGAKVGVAVACAAFITAVLGLMLFLRCKRRKGSPSKTLRRNMRILGVKHTLILPKDKIQIPSWTTRTTASSMPPLSSPVRPPQKHLPANLTMGASRQRPFTLS
nr:paired immunoglobulin-like type 2 receptor beta isoform X7 [Loxodonta africana]